MDMDWVKGMKEKLRKDDTKRFKAATKVIGSLSEDQARFALLLVNQNLRGYLMMPEKQTNFILALKRAKKARK